MIFSNTCLIPNKVVQMRENTESTEDVELNDLEFYNQNSF